MGRLMTIAILTGVMSISSLGAASAWSWDKFEDRVDRRENRLDERVDHGPLDRIEDRLDRREDRLDRANLPRSPRFNRHERRSWRRHWGG